MVKDSNGVEVLRMHRLNGDSKLKAFADVAFAGAFIVKGLKVLASSDGLFVGMPSIKGKDGKWHNTAYPLTKEFKELLSEVVLQAYENE